MLREDTPVGFITKGTNSGKSTNLRDALAESESLREQQSKASLLQTGVPGVARVTSVVDSGVRVNSEPVLDIELEVALEDGRHYETRVRELAPQMYAERVEPGANIGVRADALDPQLITLDWLRELDGHA
jgi:hypothetical protein